MRVLAVLLFLCRVAAADPIDSADILARAPSQETVEVAHILIGWHDLAASYHGKLDPRADKRTEAEAAALAREIAAKLERDPTQLDALLARYGEDPGMGPGQTYTVDASTAFVPEFKNLALRLRTNEVGLVRTQFGYHVMIRPPIDPLIATAILARKPQAGTIYVRHILISWSTLPRHDPRADHRTKAEADKLAVATLARVNAGEDMVKLMAELSEDPGSKDTGKPYEVEDDSPLVLPFKMLAKRLKVGEAALARTVFGWHVVLRVAPPPPDALESAGVLTRAPNEHTKVQHILLGWVDAHTTDPRGAKRSRAELETLVKRTLLRVRANHASFEDAMKELSEDPGSAADGTAYDVTPRAGLVKPFKALALRLQLGEIGVVKTDFGIHIVKRTE